MRTFRRVCDECLAPVTKMALDVVNGKTREFDSVLQCSQGHAIQRWLIMGSDEHVWGASTSTHGAVVWASEAEAWAARDYAEQRGQKLAEEAHKARAKAWALRRERTAWKAVIRTLEEAGREHGRLFRAVLIAEETIADSLRAQTKRAGELIATRTDVAWMQRLAERQARYLHRAQRVA